MRIDDKHHYAHGAEQVFALFTDAGEIEAKQEALGARKIRVLDCETTADGAKVRFVREMPATVPAILERFIKAWNSVEQSERWRRHGDGSYEAGLAIDVANVPVEISGSLRLIPVDGGCMNIIRIDVGCSIPFLGKTLAEFVAADCQRVMAEEHEYISLRLDAA